MKEKIEFNFIFFYNFYFCSFPFSCSHSQIFFVTFKFFHKIFYEMKIVNSKSTNFPVFLKFISFLILKTLLSCLISIEK